MLLLQGDHHVTHYIWTSQREVIGDAFYGFEQFIDHGLTLYASKEIEGIVLLGDLFDVIKPDTAYVKFVREQLDRCVSAKLPVYYIDGNHDKRPTPWLDAVHPWPVYVGDGAPFEVGGYTIQALDYSDFDTVETFVRESDCDVMLLHQQCRQYLDIAGTWDFDLTWVPERTRRVILGHVHDAWDYDMGGGRSAHYTGSTHLRAADQTYPKSSLLLREDLSIGRIPLLERAFKFHTVACVADLEALAEWANSLTGRNHVLTPCAVVTCLRDYEAEFEDLVRRWNKSDLSPKPIVIPKMINLIQEAGKVDMTQLTETLAMPELLARIISPEQDPIPFKLVLDLMRENKEPVDVIADTYQAKFGALSAT